ncbi:MAG: YeeE/YedE family protein [Oxalobacter sp.]|nr:YeeE/YedE family protein [Oxalobacter sp.]
MMIDWHSFTPASALAGGVLIGLAVMLLLLVNGKIAGISGIIGGLLPPARNNTLWRLAFLGGIFLSPVLYQGMSTLPESHIDTSWPFLIAAGLLVGFGARLGSGCTSGHGICGISRLSKRSIVATAIFMIAGFSTVFFTRHLMM